MFNPPSTEDPYSVNYEMNPTDDGELKHPKFEVIEIHPAQQRLEERLTKRALARAKQSVEDFAERIRQENENTK